ncbi:EAL domain-containing protein [Actinoplanes sp. NPDC049596]|uniref:putative bifunctional diguanylate cyclase/phosphodiesterase n=1 Tax=unclassified Actinoplanes TaxID=2626549 RepID=UPI00341372A1
MRRDPVLLAMAAVVLLGGVLFVALPDGVPQVSAFWGLQVPFDALLAVGAWRLRQISPLRFRRFWAMIAFAGACFTIGDFSQFATFASETMNGGTVQTVLFTIGMTSNVIACLIFPQGLQTRRDKSIFWLDAATVLVGGGVAAWCFAYTSGGDQFNAGLTASLVVVAAFCATKVALIPEPPMARVAAWPMVAAAGLQGIATFLPGVFQDPHNPVVLLIRLLPSALIAAGPRIQEVLVRRGGSARRVQRRPYSLLPYGMIALTFVIFFAMLPEHASSQLWGAALGVVAVAGLVAGRQLVAFHDNMTLIKRLGEHEILLREQASMDGLTGLANRTTLNGAMAAVLAEQEACVLLIDLDDFKTINDTMGHAAGDALLVEVAQRLRKSVRRDDLVARLGGDEFAVLLPGADAGIGGAIADEIDRLLGEPFEISSHLVVSRASVGVAAAPAGSDASSLLSNADIAMYEAKARGKSTWVRYTDEMGARISAEAEMVREMREALIDAQFELVYQPIVRLSDRRTTGVEALLRWNHPVRGLVSPVEFIPVAEKTGQIVAIGRWVLRQASEQAAGWVARHPHLSEMSVGVNVAGRQLKEPGFVAEVARVLGETGLPAGCLTIEVTETAVLDDQESIDTLLALRGLGVKLALDDFGTAASSLGLLLTTPVTTLKLDKSFVESITTVGRQAAVATAVSQMAGALELKSVAEGIETIEQRDLLQELGYTYGQGYLFSRPVPAAQFEQIIALGEDDGVVVVPDHPVLAVPADGS